MLDVGEGLKQYDVQIADGGVSVSNADVEYLAVQIEMVVYINVDHDFLQQVYVITSLLPEATFNTLITKLPHPTDPFNIYTWYLPYVEEDYVESDYVV